MGITNLSGRLAAIIATPRPTTLEAALQASLSMPHAPVSSGLKRVDKVGEASVARQAVDSPTQPILKAPHETATPGQHAAEPVLTHLSKTAGLLASLLPQQEARGQSHATLPTNRPVLDEPPHYPAPLATGLQTMLQDSGLFYESHLLDWYQGQYPRERLTQEPQSLLIHPPEAEVASASIHQDQTGTTTVANEAAKLITQQLLLLDKPSLEWSVNVWPGQSATMLIEEESPRADDMQAGWSTRIHLDFPKLGHMEISLKMDGKFLSVHLDAENEKTVTHLMQQRNQCAENLASTGCRLREFSIGSGDAAS